jgi:hypothetical protein
MNSKGKDVFSSPSTYLVLSAVTLGTAAALYYFFKCKPCCGIGKKQKHKGPITLEDPNIKYALKLISKEVISHDTRYQYSNSKINSGPEIYYYPLEIGLMAH